MCDSQQRRVQISIYLFSICVYLCLLLIIQQILVYKIFKIDVIESGIFLGGEVGKKKLLVFLDIDHLLVIP